jgi:hypothetical protein
MHGGVRGSRGGLPGFTFGNWHSPVREMVTSGRRGVMI